MHSILNYLSPEELEIEWANKQNLIPKQTVY
jgi:hypothetical protein